MAMETAYYSGGDNHPPQMSPQVMTRWDKVKYMFHSMDRDRDARLSKVSARQGHPMLWVGRSS
jgi:hypothetical protein